MPFWQQELNCAGARVQPTPAPLRHTRREEESGKKLHSKQSGPSERLPRCSHHKKSQRRAGSWRRSVGVSERQSVGASECGSLHAPTLSRSTRHLTAATFCPLAIFFSGNGAR